MQNVDMTTKQIIDKFIIAEFEQTFFPFITQYEMIYGANNNFSKEYLLFFLSKIYIRNFFIYNYR